MKDADWMRSFTALMERQAEGRKKLDAELMDKLKDVMMPEEPSPVKCKEWCICDGENTQYIAYLDPNGYWRGNSNLKNSFRVIEPLPYDVVAKAMAVGDGAAFGSPCNIGEMKALVELGMIKEES